jgi:uncharacterized Zn-binding protein involved in type VI secretion
VPQAARIGDPISHVGTPLMPTPAPPTGAVGLSPVQPPPVPGRPPTPVAGVPSVRIGNQAAAVTGTVCRCQVPPQHLAIAPNPLTPTPSARGPVLIGGYPAARSGDRTACGAFVARGAPNVWIGGRP